MTLRYGIAAMLLASGGCNTLHGLGRDLESAGNALANAADRSDDVDTRRRRR